MIPCYVSGAGMFATDATRVFKTLVIDWLEASGLGYDTRYLHYRAQFPEQVRLATYQTAEDITGNLGAGLPALAREASR